MTIMIWKFNVNLASTQENVGLFKKKKKETDKCFSLLLFFSSSSLLTLKKYKFN